MNRSLPCLLLLLLQFCASPVKEDSDLLLTLMRSEPAKFRHILDNSDSLEVQILYTQINRDANNRPTFKSFSFRLDSTHYFYPASTVKLPLVLES